MTDDDILDHPMIRMARIFRLAQRLGPVIREAEEFLAAERDDRGRLRWLREDGTRR